MVTQIHRRAAPTSAHPAPAATGNRVTRVPVSVAPVVPGLNSDQSKALREISKFLTLGTGCYTLQGYAGTGKTHMLRYLCKEFGSSAFAFTATTNKATKVLAKSLSEYTVPCRTIYSLLGIKMTQNEDKLVLEFPSRRPVLNGNEFKAIVVDEAGMINQELLSYIRANYPTTRWIFVGDPAQLPPVGEPLSGVWAFPGHTLTKVMRNGDHLLDFATDLRKQIVGYPKHSNSELRIAHSVDRGVWTTSNQKFIAGIERAAASGLFTKVDNTKIIAWRNRTVSAYNSTVRAAIFAAEDLRQSSYLVGDRIMVAEPIESNGYIVATIDDEGTITHVDVAPHRDYRNITCYHLTVKFDLGQVLNLSVVHDYSEDALEQMLATLAAEARAVRSKWRDFWNVKKTFHKVRFSYAITAHRSQGSSYTNVFADLSDITANGDRLESLKCLYVATTRPTHKLILK